MADQAADPATEMYRRHPETHVTDRGSGDPIVFAHGTLMDRTMFDPQIEALSPDYRTVAYDLRARTEWHHEPYDLYDLADDYVALLDGLGLDSAVLAGMSMGGYLALRVADRYPDRLEGLVLIDSISGPQTEDEREQYAGFADQIREAGTPPDHLVQVGQELLFGRTTNEENEALVEKWGDRWRTYPGESFYNEIHSYLDREDFTPELEDVDVPALSVHGEEDLALEPERAESMVEALDARQVLIPGAGHSSNLENPDPVNEAIREFLDEVY